MESFVDPAGYNLSPRTVLKANGKNHLIIVKDRKSRIIMKDGNQILEMAGKIREARPKMKVSLFTTAPVCSKTLAFLEGHGIGVIREES